VHGANRLASNSLLEGLVFGARAAAAMRGDPQAPRLFAALDQTPFPAPGPVSSPPPDEQAVRELMWRDVGLIRTRAGLESAVTCLGAWHRACAAAGQPADGRADVRRLASLVAVGLLIARAALRRAESRGGHFRADFPSRDDLHLRHHLSDARPDAAHVPS
jgi:L-aspartate oxidase